MQLPRGTFREIRKNQKALKILLDLEQSCFTGICSVSCREGICTLVFNMGKCILAEYNKARGDTALENLLFSATEDSVDAVLSTMDEMQIRLSLEFNRTEKVVRIQETISPQRVQPAPTALAGPGKKIGPEPAVGPLSSDNEIIRPRVRTSEKTPVESNSLPPAKEDEQTLLENDLDTLDTMNLDQMKSKIRDECKIMVKHLRLDHLMDKE